MSLIFHHSHLGPFVLLDFVFFDRIEPLFAAEAAEDENVAAAHSNGMCVSALVHRALVSDLVLDGAIDASVFLGRTTAASYQDLVRAKRYGGRALVEFWSATIRQLFNRPFIFIYIVAKADLWVDIVSEKVNSWRLILGTLHNLSTTNLNISTNNLYKNIEDNLISIGWIFSSHFALFLTLTLVMEGNLNSVSLMLP